MFPAPDHAKFFADEMTKRRHPDRVEKPAGALMDDGVGLNPHQRGSRGCVNARPGPLAAPKVAISSVLIRDGRRTSRVNSQRIGENTMPLTRAFRITIMERAARDARFRQRLLIEAINQLLTGDLAAGKAMLRDYVNATISFDQLARKLKKSSKSLHRMLGSQGNPTAENLFAIIKVLQAHERVQIGRASCRERV